MATHDTFTIVSNDDYLNKGYYNGIYNRLIALCSRLPSADFLITQESGGDIDSPKTLTSGKFYRFGGSLTISSTLTLSGGTAGVPTILFVDGDLTLSGTIDATAAGFDGGAAVGDTTNGNDGEDNLTSLLPWMSAGGGGGNGGKSGSDGGGGGAAVTFNQFSSEPSDYSNLFNMLAGAGGGSGGGGAGVDAGGGGAGGNGGGAVIIICTGTFDGTGGTIDVSGSNGSNGGNASSAGYPGGGGGGGGAGGTVVIAYGGSYTAPTFDVSGGSGGNGGAEDAATSNRIGGGEGSGGSGQSGAASTAGSDGILEGDGGAGGAGSAGKSYAFQLEF